MKVKFVKSEAGWLTAELPNPTFDPVALPDEDLINLRNEITEATGKHSLWEGYERVPGYPRAKDASRSSAQVRTSTLYGRIYAWLVQKRAAKSVVEFGTAFGASGMYWLAGLKVTDGILNTYEPNEAWASLAAKNLAAISPNYKLTVGTFEENASSTLVPYTVDIGFIDAIHTSVFVHQQFSILKKYMRHGGLVIFDDIGFSDDMRNCWKTIASSGDVVASASLGDRVGIVELH